MIYWVGKWNEFHDTFFFLTVTLLKPAVLVVSCFAFFFHSHLYSNLKFPTYLILAQKIIKHFLFSQSYYFSKLWLGIVNIKIRCCDICIGVGRCNEFHNTFFFLTATLLKPAVLVVVSCFAFFFHSHLSLTVIITWLVW